MKNGLVFWVKNRKVFRDGGWVFAVLWTALVIVTGVWLMSYKTPPLLRFDLFQKCADFFDEGVLHTVFWLLDTLNNHLKQILLVLGLFLLWRTVWDDHYHAEVEAMAVARETKPRSQSQQNGMRDKRDTLTVSQRWLLHGYDLTGQALDGKRKGKQQ